MAIYALMLACICGQTSAPASQYNKLLMAQLDVARALARGESGKERATFYRQGWIKAGVSARDLEDGAVHKAALEHVVGLVTKGPTSRGYWLRDVWSYGLSVEEVMARADCWGGEISSVLEECKQARNEADGPICWDRLKGKCLSGEAVRAIAASLSTPGGNQYRSNVVRLLRDDISSEGFMLLKRLYLEAETDNDAKVHIVSAVRGRPIANLELYRELLTDAKVPVAFQEATLDALTSCMGAKQPGAKDVLRDVVLRAQPVLSARAAVGLVRDRDLKSVQVVLKRFAEDSSLEARTGIAQALEWVGNLRSVQDVLITTLASEKRASARVAILRAIDLSDVTSSTGVNEQVVKRLEMVAQEHPDFAAELKDHVDAVRKSLGSGTN